MAFYDLKLNEECVADLLLYESLNGKNPDVYLYLGRVMGIFNTSQATKYIEKYRNLKPDDVNGIVAYAEILFDKGDYMESSAEYRRAVNMGYDSGILELKAELLRKQNNKSAADYFA